MFNINSIMAVGLLISQLPEKTDEILSNNKLIIQDNTTKSINLSSLKEYTNVGDIHLSTFDVQGDAKRVVLYLKYSEEVITNAEVITVNLESGSNIISIPDNTVLFFTLTLCGVYSDGTSHLGNLHFIRKGFIQKINNTVSMSLVGNLGTDTTFYGTTISSNVLDGGGRILITPNNAGATGKNIYLYGMLEGLQIRAI